MSDAIKKLHDYLAKSPSVVYPEDVLAYLSAIEAENAKLRELCADLYAEMLTYSTAPNYNASVWAIKLRELGVEVN